MRVLSTIALITVHNNFISDIVKLSNILIRINLYLDFKNSMKLIDDKDVKSRLSLFYNFIGISNKICIRYNMKVEIKCLISSYEK